MLRLVACLLVASPVLAQDESAKLATAAREALKAACGRCHLGEKSSMNYKFDVTDQKTLVNPAGGRKKAVVVPGKPDESALWEAIADERMPYPGSPEAAKFKAADLDVVKQWIAAGAVPFPRPGDQRKFVTLEQTLTAVLADLRAIPLQDRVQTRYFSFVTNHNNKDLSDAELMLHKAALSKAVNSLSWAPRVVVPREVPNSDGTLVAVRLEDLHWQKEDRWTTIRKAYPYGLSYEDHPNENLRRLTEDIGQMTRGTDLPIVRADWFTSTATRPPLYHKLLNIPDNAAKLEHQLGVDVVKNIQSNLAKRAAFTQSGVSAQNRMVERHDTADGRAYWKSYDFLPDAGRGRLARFPLGPQSLNLKEFAHLAFKHDGGEIIFNLPNGLQAYMLVDGKDNRIDEGPISVVGDNNRTSGTPAIVNGVSCMACHSNGIIRFTDTLRDRAAVYGEFAQKVRDLYPLPKEMDALLDADEKRFADALTLAVKPYLAAGQKATDLREPVQVVASEHRLRQLTLEAVARELDLPTAQALKEKLGEGPFKKLGLEGLLQEGSSIPRLEWESGVGRSLMQELATPLKYTPN